MARDSIVFVTLTAIWLTLGGGFIVARWVAFLSATFGVGAYLQLQTKMWQGIYGRYPNSELLRLAFEMEETQQWPTWYALTGGLLAAMLLFLRACGYRLAKVRSSAK